MMSDVLPLVSIAIPTYNRANGYFKQTLECALSQTYPNYEVIIADNCSTDNTGELVKSYTDSRINYYKHEKNIPANDNFNFCLEKAKGKYFLLLHDDDLIDTDFLESAICESERPNGVGIIRSGARIIDHAENVIKEKDNLDQNKSTIELFSTWLDGQTLMVLCSILFNTEYLKREGGFDSKYHLFQDVFTEFKLLSKYGRKDIKGVKGSFRKHPSQRTDSINISDWCEESIFLLNEMFKLVPEGEDVIRKKGLVHFSKHNYDLAESLRSAVKRHVWYFRIYKRIDYAYSPFQYFYNKFKRKKFSKLGKIKRKIFS